MMAAIIKEYLHKMVILYAKISYMYLFMYICKNECNLKIHMQKD